MITDKCTLRTFLRIIFTVQNIPHLCTAFTFLLWPKNLSHCTGTKCCCVHRIAVRHETSAIELNSLKVASLTDYSIQSR